MTSDPIQTLSADHYSRWSDQQLEAEIARVESALTFWIKSRGLWFDCGFKDYLSHVNGEPPAVPIVTMLWFEGPMHRVLSGEDPDGLESEFHDLLMELGYHYENLDGTTIAVYADNELISKAFSSYFHWRWVCSLINQDTADVYHEMYEQFRSNPEDLQRLSPREFEVLLFRIFQNHGFEAILGPGRGDEGVDLRILQRAPLGDVLTVVQAKRYASHRKINQTEVAALYGVGKVEAADGALFVTTSAYAPVSQRFAARTGGYLRLAARDEVVQWCANASAGVIADKSSLVSPMHVSRLIDEVAGRVDPRLVCASRGWNITDNSFALVLKETKHAALLMGIPKQVLAHDGYGQSGTHVPRLDATTFSYFSADNVWRAKRFADNGRVRYWDGKCGYYPWDGTPQRFDYCD